MKKLSSQARVTEIDDFCLNLIMLYEKSDKIKGDNYISSLITEIRVLSKDLTEMILQQRNKSKLDLNDTERDKAITNLGDALNGYCHLPIADLSESGKKLKVIFDNFGYKIKKESYINESSLIESLLTDFNKEELRQDIEKLPGIRECINNLRNAENAFKESRSIYDKSLSQNRSIKTASELKRDVLAVVNNKFLKYLDGIQLSNQDMFEDFYRNVKQIVNRTNDSVKSRRSNKSENDNEPKSEIE